MSFPEKMFEIQKNIRENSENINQYFKDLYSWEKDIIKKDNQLRGIETQSPVVIEENTKEKCKKEKKKETKEKREERLKRDAASIKDFYDRWDKFNYEENDSASEEEKTDKKNKTVINSSNYTEQYKSSNAVTNTNIVMKNNRMVFDNHTDKVEKLKIEGNTHFSIGNYYKSLEAYTSALNLLEINKNNIENYEKRKCQILNNRGNNYLKIGQYNDAISDLNIVLDLEHDNSKALYRRGLASYHLKKFRESLEDFYYLKEVDKNVDKDVNDYIEKCENEIKIRISEEIKKMKQFDPSENLEFQKIKIKEINLEEISNNKDNLELPYYYLFEKNKPIPEQKIIPKLDEKQVEIKQLEPEKNRSIKKDIEVPNKKIDIPKEMNYLFNEKNLTATNLKHNMKNYKNNINEKIQFLLKINPEAVPKIFDSDFDRDILCEILEILEEISSQKNESMEKFIIEFLRNVTKIKRFKLVSKTLSKTDKSRITNIFDELKHMPESEILSIRDSFI